jgi:hypothetical protein
MAERIRKLDAVAQSPSLTIPSRNWRRLSAPDSWFSHNLEKQNDSISTSQWYVHFGSGTKSTRMELVCATIFRST